MKTVKPAHQEFWNRVDKDRETSLRLDAVAKKLETSQAEAKEHAALPNQTGRGPSVSKGCMCVLQPTCRTPPPEKQQGHSARGVERGSP